MSNQPVPRKPLVLLSAAMIVAGLVLGIWALSNLPIGARTTTTGVAAPASSVANSVAGASATAGFTPTALPAPITTATPRALVVDPGDAPGSLAAALNIVATSIGNTVALTTTGDTPALRFGLDATLGDPVYAVTFAAATRFDTIEPAMAWSDLRANWSGALVTYTQIAVVSDTLPALAQVLGVPGPAVKGYAVVDELVAAAWEDHTTIAITPFEQLEPRLVAFAIDGQNPVENASHFDPSRYPLTATVYASVMAIDPAQATAARQVLAGLPAGNRLPERLTVIAMTGVTAMCRQTAAQMDRLGSTWPAAIVGPELASADITHVSNEVPFVADCKANTDPDNLNFCSKPEYMDALTASGVDIIGLTGNHQNDFGRENARKSLDIYEKAGLPVYGGGRTKEAAFKPLIIEHNGNRLAFLGANSYGPKFAWATDDQPGSAEFDLNIMSAIIRSLKEDNLADVVLPEMQYQESYDTQPLMDQRQDFTALVRAGADIVTGVQSHVPQGIEFTDGKLVLYGLGNLYFDQMEQTTREGMIVKHTIYAGRHISTQLLTTLVYDYGQPRWTTPSQRESILDRVFAASYW